MALNPFIADIGNLLPQVISGATIVSIVLSLPTTGPMLLRALRSQDMYLAGSFLMLLALLTVIGVFLSDLALAALDPRIRLSGGQCAMSARPLRRHGAVRPRAPPRRLTPGAGALLPRLAVADHVVEVPAPPLRGDRRSGPAAVSTPRS